MCANIPDFWVVSVVIHARLKACAIFYKSLFFLTYNALPDKEDLDFCWNYAFKVEMMDNLEPLSVAKFNLAVSKAVNAAFLPKPKYANVLPGEPFVSCTLTSSHPCPCTLCALSLLCSHTLCTLSLLCSHTLFPVTIVPSYPCALSPLHQLCLCALSPLHPCSLTPLCPCTLVHMCPCIPCVLPLELLYRINGHIGIAPSHHLKHCCIDVTSESQITNDNLFTLQEYALPKCDVNSLKSTDQEL